MRTASLAALLTCCALPAPSTARACSCAQVDVATARQTAAAVFEGRTTQVERLEGAPGVGGDESLRVTLRVVQTWKGADAEEVVVTTAGSGAACGFPFARDTSYLVYADEHQGQLRVSLCSRTRAIADAQEDLAELGIGVTPVDPTAGPPPPAAVEEADDDVSQAGCRSCAASSPRALPVELVALALLARRRRRAQSSQR